jgi:hypothetical protein
LSSNTELLLNKLFQDSLNKSKFKIELELNEGRTWIHVMNIVNQESLFSIAATGTKTKVKEKAVVDIQINKEEEVTIKAGVLPLDPLYPAKIIKEQTNLMITLDEVDKVKLELDYAEKRALEAAALLQEGEEELAENAIKEFSETFETTKEDVEDSVVLKEYAEGKLDSLEKGFQLIDEDNSLELVTNEVEEVHSLLLEVPEIEEVELHESSADVELIIIKNLPVQEDMAVIEEVIIVEYLEVLE